MKKLSEKMNESQNINELTSLPDEPKGFEVGSPDPPRVAKALETQKTLYQMMRLYTNASDRLNQNFKRLY